MTMTLITRSVSSLCTQSSDLPWRIARSKYKHFGWTMKTLSYHEFRLATIGAPFAAAPARISVVWKKFSTLDAPKKRIAKKVFSQSHFLATDDGKHYMTGTPSEHTTCQEIRHAQNTDNPQLENICVFGV